MALDEIEKLKEKVKKDPNSKLFVPLAEEYRKKGMLDEAISVLMSGLTNQPGYTSARVSLGKIYLEKKMVPDAKGEFEKVVSVIPDNLFAHKKLAEIYRDTGEKERAIGEYRVVLKLNPLDDEAVSNLNSLQRSDVIEEAEETVVMKSVPEEVSGQATFEAEEPFEKEIAATALEEEAEVLSSGEAPSMPVYGDEFEEFKKSISGQGPADKEEEAAYGEEAISDEDMEEAEKEVMSYASTFGELDLAQSSSFEGFKEEKAAAEIPVKKEEVQVDNLGEAELHISNGNYGGAMNIYKQMLSVNPQDKRIMQKTEELRMLLKILGKDKEAVIDKLETFGNILKEKKHEFFRSS